MKNNIDKMKQQCCMGISVEKTAQRIKQIIDMNGFSIKEISQLMNVSYQAVYKWINGETLPEISNFYILSKYLGVTVNDMLVPVNGRAIEIWENMNVRRIMSYYFRLKRFSTIG